MKRVKLLIDKHGFKDERSIYQIAQLDETGFQYALALKDNGFKDESVILRVAFGVAYRGEKQLGDAGLQRVKLLIDKHGFKDERSIYQIAQLGDVSFQRALTLKAKGFDESCIPEIAQLGDASFQRALTLKAKGFDESDITEIVYLDDACFSHILTLKDKGFYSQYLEDLDIARLDETSFQHALMLLDKSFDKSYIPKIAQLDDTCVQYAKTLKNNGFKDEKVILDIVYATAFYGATQLDEAGLKRAKLLIDKHGFKDERSIYQIAQLDEMGFQHALVLKDNGFKDENAILDINLGIAHHGEKQLDEAGLQRAKLLIDKHVFEDERVIYRIAQLDDEGIKRALTLKDNGFKEFYIPEIAQLGDTCVQHAITLKKEGYSESDIQEIAHKLSADFTQTMIDVKNKYPDLPTDVICKYFSNNDFSIDDFDFSYNFVDEFLGDEIHYKDKFNNNCKTQMLARSGDPMFAKLFSDDSLIKIKNEIEATGHKITDASPVTLMWYAYFAQNLDEFKTKNSNLQFDVLDFVRTMGLNDAYIKLNDAMLHTIEATDLLSAEDGFNLFRKVLSNSDKSIETAIKNADFEKYGTEGIPLSFKRSDFIAQLNEKLSKLSSEKADDILDKIGIDLTSNKLGYNGILVLKKLDKTDETEKEIYDLIYKFIYENKVQTNDSELDEILNALIKGMPEWINSIGKQQHGTHIYSVDIHTLSVLRNALNNSDYEKLSNIDKTKLKMTILLHDLSKSEGEIDGDHPAMSALWARNILEKYNFPKNQKDRIYEHILNHHWLEKYSKADGNAELTIRSIASRMRSFDDFSLAKIMAESDLKGVGAGFYETYKDSLSTDNLAKIKSAVDEIDKSGVPVFTSEPYNMKAVPTVEFNGAQYKCVNFAELPEEADLSYLGFPTGTTVKNSRFIIHTSDTAQNLFTVDTLSDVAYDALLSTSLISGISSPTYAGNRFGVALKASSLNIAAAYSRNIASGVRKTFDDFGVYIGSVVRDFIPDTIKKTLNLNDSEYAKLYQQISSKQYITQIEDEMTFVVNSDGRSFSGKEIKEVLLNAQDKLFAEQEHSELVTYGADIRALIAKVNSIEDIPSDFLQLAKSKDVPIILLGDENAPPKRMSNDEFLAKYAKADGAKIADEAVNVNKM